MPTEKVVEVRRGRKVDTERKFFPGYVLVKCDLTDEVHHLIKNTPKVTGFLGADKAKPVPIPDREAERIKGQVADGVERPKPSISFEVGETCPRRRRPLRLLQRRRRGSRRRAAPASRWRFRSSAGPPRSSWNTGRSRRSDSVGAVRGRGEAELAASSDRRPAGRTAALRPLPRSGHQPAAHSRPGDRMAKKITGYVKLQVPAGAAQPVAADRPRARPARPQHHGILQGLQCAHRADGEGHADSRHHHGLSGSFLHLRDEAAAGIFFLKEAAGIQSGSQTPGKGAKSGKVTTEQIREIATKKMPDLNCDSVEAAMAMVKGSAQSMGLEIVG